MPKKKQDSNENIKLNKESAMDTQRIDLLSALINAMVRLPALKETANADVSADILSADWGM